MKSIIQYGGWLLAIVLAIACGVMYSSMRDVAVGEPAAGVETVAATPTDLAAVQTDLVAAKEEVVKLRQELGALQADVATDAVEPSQPPEAAATEEAEVETPETESADTDDAGPSRGERIANAQLAILAGMTYKGLFDELGLAPEARSAATEVIGAHMAEAQKVAQSAMQSKDQKAKDVHARLEAMKAALRDDLAGTLTDKELEAWDEYEPVADQALYERLVDAQLNMMAAGLSEENRVLASQVMAEDLVREIDAFEQGDELYTLDNFNNAQARALQASLDRLSETLAQDQYDLVDGFVSQAVAVFDAMADQPPAE